MSLRELTTKHKLFFVFLLLFFVVGAVDILNIDRIVYKWLCDLVAPISFAPCTPWYDLPIWQVYLSLAILAALYHVHDEVRATNRHLASHKK